MAVRRSGKPYIWVTWLSKLLVGEQSCEWSPWFRSHHEGRSWDRAVRPADQGMPTLAEWQMKHTAGIVDTRESLEQQGFAVFTENQNAFRLTGETAVLAGKPDLIALKEGTNGQVLDVKTGKPSPSHVAQVLVYMYAVPKGLPQYRGVCFDGAVVYPDDVVEIPAAAVDERFVANLAALIRRVGADAPARRVPSASECGMCDIPAADCMERAVGELADTADTVDF